MTPSRNTIGDANARLLVAALPRDLPLSLKAVLRTLDPEGMLVLETYFLLVSEKVCPSPKLIVDRIRRSQDADSDTNAAKRSRLPSRWVTSRTLENLRITGLIPEHGAGGDHGSAESKNEPDEAERLAIAARLEAVRRKKIRRLHAASPRKEKRQRHEYRRNVVILRDDS